MLLAKPTKVHLMESLEADLQILGDIFTYLVRLCGRMVTVLAWTAKREGFESWFGHQAGVGTLYD